MKNIRFLIFLLLPFFLFSQETEKRLALVIGNSNYDKGELKNPVNDARLIASTLDSLDFDVILKENLSTKRDMTAAIREFGAKRSEYDVAFVYYAGHGIQVDDENFLLPTKEVFEGEFDVLDYGVSVQNIMRYLRAQTNQVNILILDACRDNPFESSWDNTRSLKGKGLAKIPPPTGSLIAFSTDSGQTAPDGDGENSVYTVSLAKNMLLEDTSIDQVFRNVRAEVLAETNGNQRPVEATQLTGQTFYLNPKSIDRFLSQIEALYNFGKYEEIIFSLSENKELYGDINFLRPLISSYEMIGRTNEAEIILDEIFEKDDNDKSVLEFIFNYYEQESSEKAGKIATKLYSDDKTLINRIRRNYYEYENSDFRIFDNLPQVKFDSQKCQQVLNNLKDDYLLLNNAIAENESNTEFYKYIYKISKSLINRNSLRISEDEYVFYWLNGMNAVIQLIEIDNKNPFNYIRYSYMLSNLDISNDAIKNNADVIKIFKKNIGKIDEQKIKVFSDSLIRVSYQINKGKNDKIIQEYFRNVTDGRDKSKYYLSNNDAQILIDRHIEQKPNNITLLNLRADFFKNIGQYELSINDYKKIISLIDVSNHYDIVETANDIYGNYESLNDNKKAKEILETYIDLTNILEIKVENFNADEKYLYGEIFNSLGIIYFKEGDLGKSKKYIEKSKLIWENKNSAFSGMSFNEFFKTENSFEEYQKKYGYWNVLHYLINLYGYTSGGKIVESYINWINSNHEESYKTHKEALFLNEEISLRAEYDYMNLTLLLNQEKYNTNYLNYLDKKKSIEEGPTYRSDHLIIKFIFDSKTFKNSNEEIRIFINDKTNRKLFNSIDEAKLRKDNNPDFIVKGFVANATCLEVINLLHQRKMFKDANILIDEILNKSYPNKINSLEFLFKAAEIKYYSDEKFKAYSLLNDAKKLLKSRDGFSLVEPHFIGYLNQGLVLNFDGISLIKEEDLNNLEKLITK